MPIIKARADELYDEQRPYITLPCESLARLRNPDAIAIWVYLLDKPPDWKIRDKEVRERLNIGRPRYRAAMAALKEAELARHLVFYDSKTGKIKRHEWVIVACPNLIDERLEV
ncbi:MAG: hypothetical protein AAGI88_15470 [Pseudomonadota bacterium]